MKKNNKKNNKKKTKNNHLLASLLVCRGWYSGYHTRCLLSLFSTIAALSFVKTPLELSLSELPGLPAPSTSISFSSCFFFSHFLFKRLEMENGFGGRVLFSIAIIPLCVRVVFFFFFSWLLDVARVWNFRRVCFPDYSKSLDPISLIANKTLFDDDESIFEEVVAPRLRMR